MPWCTNKKSPCGLFFGLKKATGREPNFMQQSGGLLPNAGWTAFAPLLNRVLLPAPTKRAPVGSFFGLKKQQDANPTSCSSPRIQRRARKSRPNGRLRSWSIWNLFALAQHRGDEVHAGLEGLDDAGKFGLVQLGQLRVGGDGDSIVGAEDQAQGHA